MLNSGYCLRYELPGKDILGRQRTAVYADSNCEIVFWPTENEARAAAQDLANERNVPVTVCTLPSPTTTR